jgi:hypothetical protein
VIAIDDMASVMLARSGRSDDFPAADRTLEVIGVDIVDPEEPRGDCPLPHHEGECRIGLLDLSRSAIDVAGLSRNFLASGMSCQPKLGRAHVDGVEIGRRALPAIQQPARVSKVTRSGRSSRTAAHHAAHAVAAGAGFRAVIVVDADEGLGAASRGCCSTIIWS